ncbi:hypothetical protein H310_08285 [Aphanomyces invadans]|uniref:Uncharacterized protein n=1 Tax=Aphanomyces invadans TaxID=157072 RepID=A0A024U157_9STRA|nr:hypothetical protein H310_08285 [Aphanomyces invadans]ETV99641.1 hypothetical protein H310_08285 [Aphanomyces invadans]|eukprot:XP_008872197.1 hypothetical protein H310_08285 [Aphanomyces invadans]
MKRRPATERFSSTEGDNLSHKFQLLEEAQVAQRMKLHSDMLQLELELRALRVLSIQDEAWQEEVTIELDGKYRDAYAALAADSAAQVDAFQLKHHSVQEFSHMELVYIQLGLEDTLMHHVRPVDAAQHEFVCVMHDKAQKEAMVVRRRALRYDTVQRERHDEFNRVWRGMFHQILAVQSEKERVRYQCVREIQALERMQIRDVRAQVPFGDRQPVPGASPTAAHAYPAGSQVMDKTRTK